MTNRTLWMCLAAGLATLCSMPASSQMKPEVPVKQRQAAMILMGKYFYGHLRPTAQGKIPYDAAVVRRNVGYVDALARMPWDGFTPATKDVKSRVAPAAFNDGAKFKEAQDRFMGEVTKLTELTRKGDEASIKAQILAVNKSCGGCHDNFREKK